MYKKLLVPVSPAEESEQVIEPALNLAKQHDAEVHLLQVVGIPMEVDAGYNRQELVELETNRAEEQLIEYKQRFEEHDLTTKTTVITDYYPAEKILEYTKENDIDLVVMASHGRSGMSRLFLGSTTERVLRGTDNTHILVVPYSDEEEEDEE